MNEAQSIDNNVAPALNTELFASRNQFDSYSELIEHRIKNNPDYSWVDVKILKAARKLARRENAAAGWGARLNWPIISKFLTDNKVEILEEVNNPTIEEVKIDNLLKDGRLKDLEIKKAEGKYYEREEIINQLRLIQISQNNLLVNKLIKSGLPQRLVGLNNNQIINEMELVVQDICSSMQKMIKSL